jgi:hypothetical protein
MIDDFDWSPKVNTKKDKKKKQKEKKGNKSLVPIKKPKYKDIEL